MSDQTGVVAVLWVICFELGVIIGLLAFGGGIL
jgi:hypothetical protein